jgi:1,4-dihydroxy-2-naphthoyl-CoA synthase
LKVSGKVAFRDVETGVWVLEGDDGQTYLLAGGDRKIKKDGSRIEAEGDLDKDSLNVAMVGPRFVVKSYKFT